MMVRLTARAFAELCEHARGGGRDWRVVRHVDGTVSLGMSREVLHVLAGLRRDGESVSDVIVRLAEENA